MTHRELFETLDREIPVMEGWCTVERASEIAAMVVAHRPACCVVLGVFGGRDTIAIALAALIANPQVRVWAIDPWSKEESIKGQTGAHLKWWSELDHEAIYKGFIKVCDRLKVAQNVLVFRMPSRNVTPPTAIDFLVCDGNHGDEAEGDLRRYAPAVVVGGIVYCDDLNWEGGAVLRGVDYLKEIGFRQMFTRDGGAYFQRMKS